MITSIMYHVGEGNQPCPFPVTKNGHGRVTEPIGDHFSGRDFGRIPKGVDGNKFICRFFVVKRGV